MKDKDRRKTGGQKGDTRAMTIKLGLIVLTLDFVRKVMASEGEGW